jgi:hypothetical protein
VLNQTSVYITFQTTQPYGSCILILFNSSICFGCPFQQSPGKNAGTKKEGKNEEAPPFKECE